MTVRLVIRAAGPGVTIQDGGRRGWARWGVTGCGAMDPTAFRLANRALGNDAEAAAIEISLGGVEVGVEGGSVAVAVAGGAFDLRLDGRRLPDAVALRLEPEARLSIRVGAGGAWTYLAVAGGLDLPPVLGSRATHVRSGLGGLDGRGLRAGDRLTLLAPRDVVRGPVALEPDPLMAAAAAVRVMLGPQDDLFEPAEIAAFLGRTWTVSPHSDRMARALVGEPLRHRGGHDIVSDAVAQGAIQVPGSGLPFVLTADRQPTGGYPKIATVIGVDLGRMAQIRPGETVRFAAVSRDEAVAARRAAAERQAAAVRTTPIGGGDAVAADLADLNLVSGVVDARAATEG